MIKGIFFDAGDTLFEARESIGASYSRFAADYGVQQDPDTLNRRFKTAFKKSSPLAFPGDAPPSSLSRQALRRLEFKWWHRIAGSVFEGIRFDDFDRFFEKLYHFYEQKAAWQLFPETKQVLSTLKKQGYFIGIISNFDSRLPPICARLGIRDSFDDLVYSSQAGFAKPASQIFDIALKQAGLSASETIHVGDSIAHDVAGAEKAGMLAVFLDRSNTASPGYRGKRIASLRGLFQYLPKSNPDWPAIKRAQ